MGLEREALEWLYYCRAVADIAEQCQQLVDTDKVLLYCTLLVANEYHLNNGCIL